MAYLSRSKWLACPNKRHCIQRSSGATLPARPRYIWAGIVSVSTTALMSRLEVNVYMDGSGDMSTIASPESQSKRVGHVRVSPAQPETLLALLTEDDGLYP